MVTEVKKPEKKTDKETKVKKLSKFAQYLKTEYKKGTISDMRAVLK
jgi:hypothetical protein